MSESRAETAPYSTYYDTFASAQFNKEVRMIGSKAEGWGSCVQVGRARPCARVAVEGAVARLASRDEAEDFTTQLLEGVAERKGMAVGGGGRATAALRAVAEGALRLQLFKD